jgi:hydrogenase nickel incorporation protein HypA/HybF
MSIAMSIVDLATDVCRKRNVAVASKIGLVIGRLSGIELQSLEFVWPLAIKGSVLEKAEKEVVIIDGKARCLECNHTYPMENHYDICPECNSYFKDIIEGKEMRVDYIEFEN